MTTTTFSRKTIAIAVAAGVSLGAVTVPQFAGVQGMTAVAGAAETETISPTSPFPEVKETMFDREYKFADAEPGSRTVLRVLASSADIQNGEIVIPGLLAGVPDEKINHIDNFYNETGNDNNTPFVRGKDYSEISKMNQFKSVRVEENGDFVISLLPGAKRIEGYIAVVLSDNTIVTISPAVGTREHAGLNFVTKNPDGTISGKLAEQEMDHLTANGKTYGFGIYGFPLLGQEPGVEVEPSDFGGSDAGKFIAGGVVARIPGQGVWKIDNDTGTIKFTPEPGFDGTPTFPRIGLVDIFNASGLIYTPAETRDADVAPLPDVMKQYTFIDMQYVMPEEYRDEAEKDPDFNPNTPTTSPAEDIYVSDVKKLPNGNYEVTRNDDKTWTINLKDIRDKIAELEKKETVTPDQLDAVKDELKKAQDGIDGLKGKDGEINKELDKLRGDLNDLKPRVDKLEKRVTKLEGLVIKEVKDNGDGTYTLIREDGSKVMGNIDTSGSVTNIKSDGKGNLIITIDGKDQTVPLSQTTVTETNKGKPNHTITITTPDGKKVTFNAFDVYVTEVKKNAKGDYDIYRSDVNDGKTVWKTIVLSDIRGKITKLEGDLTKLTEKQAKDVKDIKDQIDGLEKEIESLQGGSGDLDKRVTALETKVTALTLRVTNLEKRVKGLEETDAAWAKCYAGIGASGVPMLLALPLALMSDLNIPGLNQLNTQIQRTIGIYNPEAAKWMSENRGLFSAATGVLTAAGVLGMLIHTAKECQPYNKTPGVQDNMNPIIEGSSKIADQIESGSSKAEGEDNKGSSIDAGSSTAEGSAKAE